MTIKEALNGELEPLILSEIKMDKALEAQGLDGSAVYNSATHEKGVDLAYLTLLVKMVGISEKKEDDVSIKFTTDYKTIISYLSKKYGLVDPFEVIVLKPSVTQVNFW